MTKQEKAQYESNPPYSEYKTKTEVKKSKTKFLIPIILVVIIIAFVGLFVFVAFYGSGKSSENIQESTYMCEEDYYNCDDFSTQAEAQDVFEFCGGVDNDIHQLDNDDDGVVCEGLPAG
jgi:hypothetical protein